jgi:tetratricopeptide (TPR) repeat protein
VFALVDKLAARLLGGLGDPAANRLLRTAALTTNHLPAFKTYLRGEELMRDGRFEQAAEDYLAAIAIDSTFALAHYRLALAREWAPLPGNEDAASSAARHGARLSTRDRDLLYAFRLWRSGNALEAGHAYRAILARYPDDVDAWFQLGEIQFHHEPLLGHALEQSEEAWRKVLSFEPQNLFAITHLARIAIVARRPATLDSLLEEFGAEELHKDRRLYELAILQAVARGDTTAASTFQTRRSVQIFVGSLLFLNCRAADRRRRALRLLKRQRPSSWWQFQSGDGDSPMQLSGSQRRCRYRMPIRQLHVCLNAPRRKLQ